MPLELSAQRERLKLPFWLAFSLLATVLCGCWLRHTTVLLGNYLADPYPKDS